MNRNSVKDRRTCFTTHRREDAMGIHMICHLCKQRISPAIEEWEADHIRRHAEDGDGSPENLWPAHKPCHDKKTNTIDKREIAKGKRVAAKHYGIRKRKSRPMPGSKDSGWKKPMYGPAVKR